MSRLWTYSRAGFRRWPASIAALALILANSAFIGGAQARMGDGNRKYQAGDYKKAQEIYARLAVDLPRSPHVQNNLGLAQYKLGEWEEAAGSFRKSLERTGRDKRLAGTSLYNQGVDYARQALGESTDLAPGDRGKLLEKSLECFKDAMKADPDDMDAKYNYELLKKLTEDKGGQSQNSQDQKQNEDQQAKKDGSPQEKQGQGRQDQQGKQEGQNKQDERRNQEEKPDQGGAGEPPQGGQVSPGALTPEQAAEILKQTESLERYVLMAPIAEAPVAKDW